MGSPLVIMQSDAKLLWPNAILFPLMDIFIQDIKFFRANDHLNIHLSKQKDKNLNELNYRSKLYAKS